ncbi:pre-rRNA processing protein Utp22 [Metarhizium album ARSEF 1941]|uniref:U3 small nucleolar RNA-associated protein 22 n=1 Tax=Metarhizium album (strain ARSEF 1941) TaxID=1081103 RepID=A0A0B2X3Y4_METAS|nr:pre-rRNA processing protein Utp22 [Metarhizium album ARSEF 1941]KHO01069.1 pre-rRNA processing protein Utp22 [Metarhizium album ARSEF 1941]
MESGVKRRKIDHGGSSLRHDGLIDFESPNAARVSSASTFVLQTDELLKETKLDYRKTLKDVDATLFRLKTIVDAIEPHAPLPIAEATLKFERQHRIIVPYPDPKPRTDSPYKLSYAKPSQCNVVGSYVSKTMVKTQSALGIDMVAEMPVSLFQDKDYLSMRYFYRRAYYIAYIAAHVLNEMGDTMTLSFEYLHENPLLPVLVLRPSGQGDATDGVEETKSKPNKKDGKSHGYCIRLIPCAPDNLFPWSKLTPSADCTRLGEMQDQGGEAEKRNRGNVTPSPFYNSTLNAERTFIQYLRVLTLAKKECPAFPDACILGRIWLQQRGFGGNISQGGFGHFEWAVLIALLLQMGGRNGQPALSGSLSSTELFKAGVQFLSTTDLNKKPFVFNTANVDTKSVRETGPVMFDPVRQLNILSKMTPWSAALLQLYAKSTSELLADEGAEKFEPTFITKVNVALQVFDALFETHNSHVSKYANASDRSSVAWKLAAEMHKVLKKALGNRARLVHIQLPSVKPWLLSNQPTKLATKLLVGVIFDPAHMARQMEYGPPAEEEREAAAFRQFWGEKAELRRFKDGSILECVEWNSKLPSQICEELTTYSLRRHFNTPKEDVIAYGDKFSSLIGLSHLDKAAFDSARRSFAKFESDIRSLDNLPLQIRQLSPVSPSARYSSPEPPMPGFHMDATIRPMDVNLYFEASSKWPENLTAIQEAKIEFLLDFDRRLTAANDRLMTHLGRENRDVGIENLAYLDVVYDNGASFRLRIYCDLEETLLERRVQNQVLDHHVREEASRALAALNWYSATLSLQTQTIATFCTRLQPLSPSIRLVKHWFASHKLCGHLSDELIELFVLHVFLQPYPWMTPSSPTTGLLRTLFFLARWDWRDEPLIVDSAETISAADRSTMHRELESWRRRDPHMNNFVMFVATSSDRSGLAYTRDGPSKLIASRMTRLAKAAYKLVHNQGANLKPESLFESSLQDYDVLVHLSTKAIKSTLREAATEPGARRHSQYKNLDARAGKMPLPTRAHPSAVLAQELQRAYDDTLVFFSGGPNDSVLAAIWSPKLQKRQKFRAGLPYNFRRVAGNNGDDDEATDVVEVNRQAILLELARAGGDMIKRIEVGDDEE